MSVPAAQPILAAASRAVRQLQDLGGPLPSDVSTQLARLESSELLGVGVVGRCSI